MEKMLVTQGLNELKTLESRIQRAINSANLVTLAKTCESKVTPNKTKEEFNSEAEASYQSVIDLIARREKIKTAIVDSNATTMVEINGEKMSVAKAIDLKTSIIYRQEFLDKMKNQLRAAEGSVNLKNAAMEKNLDQLVLANFSKDSKGAAKPEEYEAIAAPFRKANEYSLVDPLSLEKKIEEEEKYIEGFLSHVDQVLQVSNCITSIEI